MRTQPVSFGVARTGGSRASSRPLVVALEPNRVASKLGLNFWFEEAEVRSRYGQQVVIQLPTNFKPLHANAERETRVQVFVDGEPADVTAAVLPGGLVEVRVQPDTLKWMSPGMHECLIYLERSRLDYLNGAEITRTELRPAARVALRVPPPAPDIPPGTPELTATQRTVEVVARRGAKVSVLTPPGGRAETKVGRWGYFGILPGGMTAEPAGHGRTLVTIDTAHPHMQRGIEGDHLVIEQRGPLDPAPLVLSVTLRDQK